MSDRNPERDCLHEDKLGDYYDEHELWDEDEPETEIEAESVPVGS